MEIVAHRSDVVIPLHSLAQSQQIRRWDLRQELPEGREMYKCLKHGHCLVHGDDHLGFEVRSIRRIHGLGKADGGDGVKGEALESVVKVGRFACRISTRNGGTQDI